MEAPDTSAYDVSRANTNVAIKFARGAARARCRPHTRRKSERDASSNTAQIRTPPLDVHTQAKAFGRRGQRVAILYPDARGRERRRYGHFVSPKFRLVPARRARHFFSSSKKTEKKKRLLLDTYIRLLSWSARSKKLVLRSPPPTSAF